jgi:hypothetical protein
MLANVRPLLRKPRISNDLAFKLTGFWHALNQLVLQSLVVSLGVVMLHGYRKPPLKPGTPRPENGGHQAPLVQASFSPPGLPSPMP